MKWSEESNVDSLIIVFTIPSIRIVIVFIGVKISLVGGGIFVLGRAINHLGTRLRLFFFDDTLVTKLNPPLVADRRDAGKQFRRFLVLFGSLIGSKGTFERVTTEVLKAAGF